MELLGDMGKVEAHFFCVQTVLISAQDSCMVCAKCTTGMKIVLGVPDGTLGVVGQVEARFNPSANSVTLDARYMYGLRQTHHRLRNHFGCI